MATKVSPSEIATRLAAPGATRYSVAKALGVAPSTVYRAEKRAAKPEAFATRAMSIQSAARRTTFSELGTTGLRRFGGRIDDEYDRSFKDLSRKLALFREMSDDPIVAATDQAIRMVIRRVAAHAEPGGESAADIEASEFLAQAMDDMSMSWSDTIDNVLTMFRNGFQLAELVYKKRTGPDREPASKYDDGRIGWRKWTFLAGDSLDRGEPWLFDEHGGLQGCRQTPYTSNGESVEIPIEKLLLFLTTTENANPEGKSLLRAMHSSWHFKHNLEEIEAISAERMGAGFPVFYLGSDVGKGEGATGDVETIKNMVVNVRVDDQMGLVLPWAKMGAGAREGEGVLFELQSPPSKGVVDFNVTIGRHEQRMAMVALAQFIHLGMNQVGARSLGESSQDFFTLAVSGWVDSIYDTLNRFAVERLFQLNYFPGMTAMPTIAHESVAQTNLIEVADYINKLVGANVLTPDANMERSVRELADLPENQDLDKVYEIKAEQQAMGLEGQKAALEQAKQAPAPATVDQEKGKPVKDDEMIAVLRQAVEALRYSERAEQFTSAPSQPVVVNIDNRPEKVVVEQATFNAPEMGPVAEALRGMVEMSAAQQGQAERFALDATVQGERMALVVREMGERPIVVNVPETVVNVAAPNVTVNVPAPEPVVVHVAAPVVNVNPEIRFPETEETITVERDEVGLMKSATKRRKVKR